MAGDGDEWGRVISFEKGWQARAEEAMDATILATRMMNQERSDFLAFRDAAWVELARKDEEHAAVLRGMAAALADRDADLRRVAWALWLDERFSLLVGALALLWAAVRAPRVKHVGRRYGPTSGQLAAVAGVLVAFAVIALIGLVG